MNSSTFNSRSGLKAYALAAILVVAAHIGFASSDSLWGELYRFSMPVRDDSLRIEANLKLASGDHAGAPILLMGSSQTREDFDVEYLNRRFQGRHRFVNMGVSGQGNPIEMYMMTPRAIESKPSLVIYMPFMGSLFYPYAYNTFDLYFDPNILPLIHELYGWGEVVDRADSIAWGYLGRYSVLFRYRRNYQHMIDDSVRRWIASSPPKETQTFAYHRRKPVSHFQQQIARHRKRPRFHDHRHRALSQAAFHQMVQSLNARGIPLLVIDGPTNPLIRYFYDPSLDAVYGEFWRAASATHEFTYLPAAELPKFGDADFNDFTHLNAAARARFSAFIADYLQANAARLGLANE